MSEGTQSRIEPPPQVTRRKGEGHLGNKNPQVRIDLVYIERCWNTLQSFQFFDYVEPPVPLDEYVEELAKVNTRAFDAEKDRVIKAGKIRRRSEDEQWLR